MITWYDIFHMRIFWRMIIRIRRRRFTISICILIVISILLIRYGIPYALQRHSPQLFISEKDLSRYANVTWPRRRIPRVIHQTYRTYDIPVIWNISVQSIIETNANEFKYRRWSHADMDAFVQKHEPHFYRNTYVTYKYDMQRIDSFRYVLMFHLGGIYIDMDNGCNHPFHEIVVTMEALDPYSPYLALFSPEDIAGVQTDFMISTAGHPIYKQFISRLHLFNCNFLLHHLTILLSAGPLYASVQERFFKQTDQQVVRILDSKVHRSMFWKTNGGTWYGRDTYILFDLYDNRHRILWYCKIFAICLAVLFVVVTLCRCQRRHFPVKLTIIQSNDYLSLKNSRQRCTLDVSS